MREKKSQYASSCVTHDLRVLSYQLTDRNGTTVGATCRAGGQHQQPTHTRHTSVGRLDDHRATAGERAVTGGDRHLWGCMWDQPRVEGVV